MQWRERPAMGVREALFLVEWRGGRTFCRQSTPRPAEAATARLAARLVGRAGGAPPSPHASGADGAARAAHARALVCRQLAWPRHQGTASDASAPCVGARKITSSNEEASDVYLACYPRPTSAQRSSLREVPLVLCRTGSSSSVRERPADARQHV